MQREKFTAKLLAARLNELDVATVYGQLTEPEWGDAMHDKIPKHMHRGILFWVASGVEPGAFLKAVLIHRLLESVLSADYINLQRLPAYVRFLMNTAPDECWGSVPKFIGWQTSGGLIGRAERRERLAMEAQK
jgi:hypothetical protein